MERRFAKLSQSRRRPLLGLFRDYEPLCGPSSQALHPPHAPHGGGHDVEGSGDPLLGQGEEPVLVGVDGQVAWPGDSTVRSDSHVILHPSLTCEAREEVDQLRNLEAELDVVALEVVNHGLHGGEPANTARNLDMVIIIIMMI